MPVVAAEPSLLLPPGPRMPLMRAPCVQFLRAPSVPAQRGLPLEPSHIQHRRRRNNKLLRHTYTVQRRDTLARIVSATGAHSRTDRHRVMIAIFRANPAAFQNNFNRLRTGVTLQLPTADIAGGDFAEEVSREYDAQMAAWRASGHRSPLPCPRPCLIGLARRAAVPTQPPSPSPYPSARTTLSIGDRRQCSLNEWASLTVARSIAES